MDGTISSTFILETEDHYVVFGQSVIVGAILWKVCNTKWHAKSSQAFPEEIKKVLGKREETLEVLQLDWEAASFSKAEPR